MRRIFSRSFVCSSIGVRNAAAYARRPSSADRTAESDPQVTTRRSGGPSPLQRQGSPEVTWLSSRINNVPLTAERFHGFTRSAHPMPAGRKSLIWVQPVWLQLGPDRSDL